MYFVDRLAPSADQTVQKLVLHLLLASRSKQGCKETVQHSQRCHYKAYLQVKMHLTGKKLSASREACRVLVCLVRGAVCSD